jgi:hypothetical protein
MDFFKVFEYKTSVIQQPIVYNYLKGEAIQMKREIRRKQAGAELCQAQAKLSYPVSSLNLSMQLFFQVEMNKVSGWNKLNNSQANCPSDLTRLKSWNLGRTAVKKITFPKHKNERTDHNGKAYDTVPIFILFVWIFFKSLKKIKMKLSKNWPSYEKNSQNRKRGATRARTSADKIQLARRYHWVLGSIFLFDNLSLASKLCSVEVETWNVCSAGVNVDCEAAFIWQLPGYLAGDDRKLCEHSSQGEGFSSLKRWTFHQKLD